MASAIESRIESLEKKCRRQRYALVAFAGVIAVGAMVGLAQEDEPSIDGFAVIHQPLTYFRLVNRDTVEVLDQSRGDRWFWRRIRNWPD